MTFPLASKIGRHWQTAAQFGRARDRFLYFYGRVLRRGTWPLPGRSATVDIRLRGEELPFSIRLSSTDWLVFEEVFLKGEYAFVKSLPVTACIVDLGANVGFTLRYWHRLFPGAHIIAMEPEAGNCEACRRNIQTGRIAEFVTLVEAGAGSERRWVRLSNGGGEWAYSTRGTDPTGERVEVRSLEEVLNQYAKGQVVDLLKCDIEGAEEELFSSCRPWIGRVQAIAVELHPPYDLDRLLADLTRAEADFEVAVESQTKANTLAFLRRAKAGKWGS
jgi:FkbM family methyltransferase